jgi:glycosyltransferase involved in cell wall biosynthesis/predicted SAM-dependent methyltransferase
MPASLNKKIIFVIIKYAFEVSPTIKDMAGYLRDNGFTVDILTDKYYRDKNFSISGVNIISMEDNPGRDELYYSSLLKDYSYIFAIDYLALSFLGRIGIQLSNVVYLSFESTQYMLKEPKEKPLSLLNQCRLGIMQSRERLNDFKDYFDKKLKLEFEYLPVSVRPVRTNTEKNSARIIYSGYLAEWSGMLEFVKLFTSSRYRGFFELRIQGHAMGTDYYVKALQDAASVSENISIDHSFYNDEEHLRLLAGSNIGIAVYNVEDNSPNWSNLLFSSGKIASYLWTGCAVITNIKNELTERAPFIYIKDLSDLESFERGCSNYLDNMELYHSEALLLADKYYNLDKYAKTIMNKLYNNNCAVSNLPESRIEKQLISENKMQKTEKQPGNNPGGPVRLHLGCGEKYLQGYVNIDYPSDEHNVMNVRPDLACDLMELRVPDATVDEIRLHHVFEHFNRVTALALLIRWYGWLKPGGILHIETPDLIGSAKTLLSDESFKVKMGVVRHLAGDQAASWAYHVDQWFPERYKVTLEKLGFGNINITISSWEKEPYLSNVEVRAVKTTTMSLQEQILRADELLWDSTVSPKEERTYNVWRDQLRKVIRGEEIYNSKQKSSNGEIAGAVEVRLPAVDKAPYGAHAFDFNQRERDNWVMQKAASVPAGATVLDIGAGTCPYRDLFRHCNYVTHDFKKYEGVKLGHTNDYGKIDVESDIVNIPLKDNYADYILCTEVLEHVPEPIEALKEMARLLKPGGKIFITAPLGSGLHQLPYHYYGGYTPEWYRHFGEKFGLDIKEITPNGGFFKLLSQESLRFKSTLQQDAGLHGEYIKSLEYLFGEWMPKYLYELESKHFIDQFTVGYHVEYEKKADVNPTESKEKNRYDNKQQVTVKGNNNSLKAAAVIFSKNRAMQLDAALKSFYSHCSDPGEIKMNVLYAVSGRHAEQYKQLAAEYADVNFIKEDNFRTQLLNIVNGTDYILFLVDDNIFVNDLSMAEIIKSLNENTDSIGFSLRLGRNTGFCYPKNSIQHLPHFSQVKPGILIYDWTTAHLDFNYPLEVSSSLYRTSEVLPVLEKAQYKNPNTLEGVFAEVRGYYAGHRQKLLCFESSAAFCIPVNKVQEDVPNRSGSDAAYDAESLADMFDRGERIDISVFNGFVPSACHQEVELKFENSTHENNGEIPLTVYTCAYNAEKYIAIAIESVLSQSFTDFEYIIVDDGSTDRTAEIVKSYRDKRIKLFEREHKNFASAMNYAITKASGKYITGVDADDFIAKDYFEKLYTAALQNPEADYIYPEKFTIVDALNNLTGETAVFEDFSGDKNILLLQKLFFEAVGRVPNPGSLKKRDMYNRLGLYEEIDTIEDFVFLSRNSLDMQFKRADGVEGYLYRMTPGSNSSKFAVRGKIMAEAIFNMASGYTPDTFFPGIQNIQPSEQSFLFLKKLYEVFKKHSEFYNGRGGEHFLIYADKISEMLSAQFVKESV